MSAANRPRRVLAEISWADDSSAVMWVGSRTLHQYWPLLSGYFRDILLPPHRRAGENAVSWSWQEPSNAKPPSASELASVRKRLSADHQLFADNLARDTGARADNAALRGQGNVDELDSTIAAAISRLIGLADGELVRFVCRTEHGVRVHSWGAPSPAAPVYPDDRDWDVSGQVLVGDQPAAGVHVTLANLAGREVDRVETDRGGKFVFTKVATGRYRLFAESATTRKSFPADGLEVGVETASVSGLLLRDQDAAKTSVQQERAPTSRRTRWLVIAACATTLILGGAGWFVWQRADAADARRVASRGGELNSSHAIAPELPHSARERPPLRRAPVAAAEPRITAAPDHTESSVGLPRDLSAGGEFNDRDRPVISVAELEERKTVMPKISALPGSVAGAPLSANGTPLAAEGGAAVKSAGAAAGTSASAQAVSATTPGGASNTDDRRPKAAPSTSAATARRSGSTTAVLSDPPRRSATSRFPSAAPTPSPAADAPSLANEFGTSAPDFAGGNAAHANTGAAEPLPDDADPRIQPPNTENSAASGSPSADPRRDRKALASDTPEDAVHSHPEEKSGSADATTAAEALPSRSVSPMHRRFRIQFSGWRRELLGEVILPTIPVPTRQNERLPELRAKAVAEQLARIPSEFREARLRTGFVFRPDSESAGALRWIVPSSRIGKVETNSSGSEAELIVSALNVSEARQAAPGAFHLVDARRVLATVRLHDGAIEIHVAHDVVLRQWLDFDSGTASDNSAQPERFHWLARSRLPLPPQWAEATNANPGSHRVHVSLHEALESGGSGIQPMALCHEGTGWALVGEWRAESELLGAR